MACHVVLSGVCELVASAPASLLSDARRVARAPRCLVQACTSASTRQCVAWAVCVVLPLPPGHHRMLWLRPSSARALSCHTHMLMASMSARLKSCGWSMNTKWPASSMTSTWRSVETCRRGMARA